MVFSDTLHYITHYNLVVILQTAFKNVNFRFSYSLASNNQNGSTTALNPIQLINLDGQLYIQIALSMEPTLDEI